MLYHAAHTEIIEAVKKIYIANLLQYIATMIPADTLQITENTGPPIGPRILVDKNRTAG